jgi:hypothetical protein
MTVFNQLAFRDRLYQALPGAWFPDLNEAPNLAAVLDMMASAWTSEQVVNRVVQFPVSSETILIDGKLSIPAGSKVTGTGLRANPVVIKTFVQTIDGTVYQTVTLSVAQTLEAGSRLSFHLPDTAKDGIAQFLDYAQSQSRLQTASSEWLDLFGEDFFGPNLQRHTNEVDASYRSRLLTNVLSPKVTRCSIGCGITNLTGYPPTIIEPRNTGDCGSYASLENISWGGMAYSKAGSYGSMDLPYQFFIRCTRPLGEGIPTISGYNMSGGGYATAPQPFGFVGALFPAIYGTSAYSKLSDLDNNRAVTDDDIYNQVASSVAAGVTAWTSISSDIESQIRSGGLLDVSCILDMTTLIDTPAQQGQIFGTGSFSIVADGQLVFNSLKSAAALPRFAAAGVIDNPISLSGSPKLRIAALGGINMIFAEGAASFALAAQGAISSNVTSTSVVKMPALAASGVITTDMTIATGVGLFSLTAKAKLDPEHGLPLWSALKVSGLIMNGTAGIDHLSVDFVLGSATLTPPGSRLGQTLVLGSSQIGIDYGF